MIERFLGPENRDRLIEALRSQAIIRDDLAIASSFADALELRELSEGERLITEASSDDDVFLILSGRVAICVKSREIAVREAGQHVGEMALIDPTAPRAASVVAIEPTVVAKVTEQDFTRIADSAPRLWRLLSISLCERLRQRNNILVGPNPRSVVFIGSAVESLRIAQEIQSQLRYDELVPKMWTDSTFHASKHPIEDLEREAESVDFAVVVVGPDDKTYSRGKVFDSPRDNVIFELGLFMGALGRERTFLIKPRGLDIKIPSDLFGLNVLDYEDTTPRDLPTHIGPICTDLRKLVSQLGPR